MLPYGVTMPQYKCIIALCHMPLLAHNELISLGDAYMPIALGHHWFM